MKIDRSSKHTLIHSHIQTRACTHTDTHTDTHTHTHTHDLGERRGSTVCECEYSAKACQQEHSSCIPQRLVHPQVTPRQHAGGVAGRGKEGDPKKKGWGLISESRRVTHM